MSEPLGELPTWTQLAGGVLIIGGVALVRLGERPAPAPVEPEAEKRQRELVMSEA